MATRARSGSASAEREHHRTSLWAQLARFIGLYGVPFLGLLSAWAVHVWVTGLDVHWWVIDWEVHTSPAAVTVAVFLITIVTIGMAYQGYQFAEHRKPILQQSLAGSILLVGALFAINVGTGPHYWWSGLFLVASWAVAVIWTIARLDVTRNDKKEDGDKEDTLLEKLGLKGWNFKVKEQVRDPETGKPIRTEVAVTHAPGETKDKLQQAVGGLESATASPAGLSTATGSDRADQSTLTLIHVDALKERVAYGPEPYPGGSIEDPLMIGVYQTGHPAWCYLGGGPMSINPTGYIVMGTSRAGKTLGENLLYTSVGSRTDVCVLYLNKAKGRQDIRPIAPVIEVAVLSKDPMDYVNAFTRVKKILDYREAQLAAYGLAEWSAKRCYYNPPQRKVNGEAIPMEPMPFLMLHIGEADAILDNYKSEDGAIYLASKGLSLGVSTGWSLQRAGHDSMPTGLRDNLGARWCYGTLSATATAMALSESTRNAGATPENWGARKPGYHFFEGPGVDETEYPKVIKTMSLAPGMDPKVGIDEHNAAMREEMLRRNLQNAPKMARLDRGSALATGDLGGSCWWDVMARQTEEMRVELGVSINATPSDRKPQTATVPTATPTANPAPAATANPTADADSDDIVFREEIRNLREVDGVELYPADEDGTAEDIDPEAPLERRPELKGMSWGAPDDRPVAPSREEAVLGLGETLTWLQANHPIRDDEDESVALIKVSDITAKLKYRSRPWFSTLVAEAAVTGEGVPSALVLERADDMPVGNGRPNFYRLGLR